jgi:hypothetical protein
LIVNEKIIVELKAVRTLDPVDEAQLINYFKARPHPLRLSPQDAGQASVNPVGIFYSVK